MYAAVVGIDDHAVVGGKAVDTAVGQLCQHFAVVSHFIEIKILSDKINPVAVEAHFSERR